MSVSLVNSWAAQSAPSYGLNPVAIANTGSPGNAILAVAGWAPILPNLNPVAYVADDVHNWWDHLATSQAAGHSRCTMWIASSAQAAANVSLATSWPALATAVSVFEISGLPAYTQTVQSVSTPVNAATTIATNFGSVASGDTVIAILCAGNTPGLTVTYPAGWTALPASVININPPYLNNAQVTSLDVGIYAAMITTSSPGSVTASWTVSATADLSAAMVDFPVSPSPAPTSTRAGWPVLKAELAFGSQPGDPTSVPAWTDVTTRVVAEDGSALIDATRGRDYELTAAEAGDFTVSLLNTDGTFTPNNSSSPYSPNVVPETPFRVSAIWNGIRFPVCAGNVESWPTQWPDPQWGMSVVKGTDPLGALSNIVLPSSLGGEILTDSPYMYFPCGEIYNEANGLPLSNMSRTNQRQAVCMDAPGGNAPLATGQQTFLNGDMNTGIGYSAVVGGNAFGPAPGAFYEAPDIPQMPNGVTMEFWFGVPNTFTQNVNIEMFRMQGAAGNYLPPAGSIPPVATRGGGRAVVFLTGPASANLFELQLTDFENNVNVMSWTAPTGTNLYDGNCHHYVITIAPNGAQYSVFAYLDGAGLGGFNVSNVNRESDVDFIGIGPVIYSSGGAGNGYNYTIAHTALYGYVLHSQRINAHYQAGKNGATGDTPAQRAMKLMAWGGYTGPRAALGGSVTPLLGPGDQIQQSSLTEAENTVATTDGGMFYSDGAGNATYWSRPNFYNRTPRWIFGDNPPIQVNGNSTFENGVLPWTGFNGAALTSSSVLVHSGQKSMLLTPNGTAFPGASSELCRINPSVNYSASAWVNCPTAGWAAGVQAAITWFNAAGGSLGTTSGSIVTLPAGAWTQISLTNATPLTNAVSAQFVIQIQGSPSTVLFYIDDAALVNTSQENPYDPSESYAFDNSYIYNLVQSQRTISAGSFEQTGKFNPFTKTWTTSGYGATAIAIDQPSVKMYYQRGPLTLNIETSSDQDSYDIANWNLQAYKQPGMRVSRIELIPSANPALWPVALGIEQGDICQVIRRPLGAPPITSFVIVQKIEHGVQPNEWKTTLNLSPYTIQQNVLQLDTAGYDVVGNNRIAW